MVKTNQIINADNVETLRGFPDDCIDSIVTDPPYGLAFMGKKWDYDVPSVELWQECLRVLKPGGHLLAFAGTRTQHRMAVRIEDAGFEIRDMIAWVYGSGFPKSLDVSKAIDKAAGAEREVVGQSKRSQNQSEGWDRPWKRKQMEQLGGSGMAEFSITAPATEAAKQWQGWGTALKPSLEPVTVARKPLAGTVADNVLQWGTGAINVDGCRVGTDETLTRLQSSTAMFSQEHRPWKDKITDETRKEIGSTTGRWPANLIHDGSEEVTELFPETESGSGVKGKRTRVSCYGTPTQDLETEWNGDSGSAARFFYCAKADASERRSSKHPTVKPLALMRYLVRLVTPIGGIVLDPFGGSGSTAEAARLESCRYILIEREAEYCRDAAERLRQGVLF